MSSERAVFLDTDVFKGPRLSTLIKPGSHLCDKHNTSEISISTRKKEHVSFFLCLCLCLLYLCYAYCRSEIQALEFRFTCHFKPTKTFQYTHFSSCHPFITEKGFMKGEALWLLTNSVKENFCKYKRDFELKDSVTEAIPLRSSIKSWLKFSSSTGQRLFGTKQRRWKKFYRLLPLITRPHWILKRFSLNTGISFNSNLDLHIFLTSHWLYLTGRKNKNHSRTF